MQIARSRALLPAAALLAAWLGVEPTLAEPVRIGIAAPLSGPSERLGRQIVDGATAAAGDAAIEVADDACTAAGGAAAARRFIAAKVSVVVGFLCVEAIEAALPILRDAKVPVVTPGVRTDSLTDRKAKTRFPVYRLAPRDDAEAEAVARIMPELWKNALFAVIDDGTIYGRQLAETLRGAAEQAALKPVFVDTFRPQMDNQIGLVGRLRKAGATSVFVGGDRDDVAVMTRDAARSDPPIQFAGGEALRSAAGDVPLAAGTLMVGLPEWAEIAEPSAIAALTARGVIAQGYVLPAHAAMQVAIAAAGRPGFASVPEAAFNDDFITALGSIRFDAKGDLAQNPYRLFRFDGHRFAAVAAP